MKINNLKILPIAICFLVSALCSGTQCMDETVWFGYNDESKIKRHIIVYFSVDKPQKKHIKFQEYKEIDYIPEYGEDIFGLFLFDGYIDLDFRKVKTDNHINFIGNLLERFMEEGEDERNWEYLNVFNSLNGGKIRISHFINPHLIETWKKKLDDIYNEIDKKLEKSIISNYDQQKQEIEADWSGKNRGQLQKERDEYY